MKTINVLIFDDEPAHLMLYERLLGTVAIDSKSKYAYTLVTYASVGAAKHEISLTMNSTREQKNDNIDIVILGWNIAHVQKISDHDDTSVELAVMCIENEIPLLIRTSQDGKPGHIIEEIEKTMGKTLRPYQKINIKTTNGDETKFDEGLREEIDAFVEHSLNLSYWESQTQKFSG